MTTFRNQNGKWQARVVRKDPVCQCGSKSSRMPAHDQEQREKSNHITHHNMPSCFDPIDC